MQFISRLLLCSFDVASFSKKLKMASSRKRVAVAAANYDSGEDMPDLVVAGPSGGPALYLQPPVLQAERSSSESSEGQEEEGTSQSTCGNRWTLVCLQCRAVSFYITGRHC